MPRARKTCKHCRVTSAETGLPMTARGLCVPCGLARIEANIVQLHEHRGPFFDHWRARCLAAFGVTIVDEPQHGR